MKKVTPFALVKMIQSKLVKFRTAESTGPQLSGSVNSIAGQ
jgi:hypothetical protein